MKRLLPIRIIVLRDCLLLLTLILVSLYWGSPAAGAGDDSSIDREAWQRHRAAVSGHPDILRYYTFEEVTIEKPNVASVAGEAKPLSLSGPEPLVLVDSCVSGKTAVRLDQSWLQGEPFEIGERGCTIEMRFRKLGPGKQLGNGRTNGMLIAQGDGYWSGLRIWTDYPERRLRFEIGRPRPENSFGMNSAATVPDCVWHHLAATWDGRQMRLYLNGIPLGAADYEGTYTTATGMLKIGYANAGIGSLRMDVDQVAIYRTALSPGEILRHAFFDVELPQAIEARFVDAAAAIARQEWWPAHNQLAAIIREPQVPSEYQGAARLADAVALQQAGTAGALNVFAELYGDPQMPASLRQIALRFCVPDERHIPAPKLPAKIYEALSKLDDLPESQRLAVQLVLAERHLQDGDVPAARELLRTALQSSVIDPSSAWNLRLQLVHSFLAAGQYYTAREGYRRIAAMDDCPAMLRYYAELCVGHSYYREKQYGDAATSFGELAARAEVPLHFRLEATERRASMERLAAGQPEFDPSAGRVQRPPAPEPSITLHVSTSGDDGNAGTREQPLATLQGARDAIRRLRSQQGLPAGGATVLIHEGTYAIRETLELTGEDSGTPASPIVYRSVENERPVFTGGVRLTGFQRVTDASVLERLSPDARNHVVRVDLRKQGITDFGRLLPRGYGMSAYPTNPWVDLYFDGRPLMLARWPDAGFVQVGKVHQGRFRTDDSGQPGEFEYADDRPSGWKTAADRLMFGAWGHLWAGRYVRIAEIDAGQRRIRTADRASYGFREGQPYFYLNILEELDRPEEWYLDRETGYLYLYATAGLSEAAVELPLLSEPFVRMNQVQHVTLRGLTFQLGRTDGIVMLGGRDNLLAGCTVQRVGGNGVIVQGGTGHGILGCDLATLGAGGVRMAGGDRKTLEPGGHFVENCHLHDFSRVDRVYAPAVHLDGVGNRIAHNLMHDSPHHALRVEGWEHVIEFNEVHSVVYEYDDQAGIDIYGHPGYRGLVIRYNFWHHIGSGHDVAGQAGIRLDDYISAVRMIGNVFYRSAGGRFGGIQIHGGKDNIADNNLFIDCKYAFSFSPWGQQRWEQRLAEPGALAQLARDGINRGDSPHRVSYPDLANLPADADRNFLLRNLAVDCGQFRVRDRGVNQLLDNHQVFGDPGFADRQHGDFSLPSDFPLYDRCGFRPIPFGEIGLYEDASRASWPVKHQVSPRFVQEN